VSKETHGFSGSNLSINTLVIKCLWFEQQMKEINTKPGNTKWGSITVQLTSCLTCLDSSVLQIKTKIVNCNTADSKPVKQEVNGTMILPPLVFPDKTEE